MSIKEILMKRDRMSAEDAEDLIEQAREDLLDQLTTRNLPFDLCAHWFGLEADCLLEADYLNEGYLQKLCFRQRVC
ncbi:MAG: hypothetical protein DRN37_00150 [Thermoplasmata archaeon]|nr:MAG: hypothetical protein DRN37_00150 [Thermoplasmata archaeon]